MTSAVTIESNPKDSQEPAQRAVSRPEAVADRPFGDRIAWRRFLPFLGLHLAVISVLWVGVSTVAIVVAVGFLFLRVFALTGFYHRYFSHRAFKTSRWFQFLGALLGNMAAQRGPLWWAAHHREHHRNSDNPKDVHSPRQHGFLWSHLGWFLAEENLSTDTRKVKDWLRYPELGFLDRYHLLVPLLTAFGMFALGAVCAEWFPSSGTSGAQMLVWGFLISTLALYHITYAVNSVAHEFGQRRFVTRDDSRNNFLLALLTFGEGWHNNHHRYAVSARQGFYWWEIDVTYYILRGLALLGLVWDLKPVPSHILTEGRRSDAKAPPEETPVAVPGGGDRP